MGLSGRPPYYSADFLHTPSQRMRILLSRVLLFCSSHCCAAGPLARWAAPFKRRRVFKRHSDLGRPGYSSVVLFLLIHISDQSARFSQGRVSGALWDSGISPSVHNQSQSCRHSTRVAKETHAARGYPAIHKLHRTVGRNGFFLTTRLVARADGGLIRRAPTCAELNWASRNNLRLSGSKVRWLLR
jgi:hypothetical protein